MTTVEDLFQRLSDNKYLSKIDLSKMILADTCGVKGCTQDIFCDSRQAIKISTGAI